MSLLAHPRCSHAHGHLFAFGCTEEHLLYENLGCKPRGRPCDGPLKHATGKGWVKGGVPWDKKGAAYRDATTKGHTVKMAIVETLGGISPHTRAIYRRHARRATAKGARDSTKYGTTRISTRSFYTHHTPAPVDRGGAPRCEEYPSGRQPRQRRGVRGLDRAARE